MLKASVMRLLVSVVFILPGFSIAGYSKQLDFFTERLEHSSVNAAAELKHFLPSANVRRLRPVDINPALSQPGQVQEGDIIVVNPFPGTRFETAVERVAIYAGRTVTMRARLREHKEGYLLVSTTDGRTMASLEIPVTKELYAIVSNPAGPGHYVAELDLSELDVVDRPDDALVPPTTEELAPAFDPLPAFSNTPSNALFDVMVVYTPAARAWAGSDAQISNVIALAMERAQLVLDNSHTGVALRLVHTAEVPYVESGNSSADLIRLTASPQNNPWGDYWEGYYIPGFMDEVHTWRNLYGADLVVLLTRVEDTGGVGWLLNSSSGRPDYGFSITRVQQASWTYTKIHEIGHNLGCHHHRDQLVQPGPGLFSYSSGWRWAGNDGGRYCSVMTYESGQYFSDGINHTTVPYFSNPDVLHFGVPTGNPVYADNARTIREVKSVVANYRPHRTLPPPSLDPTGGEFDGPVQVTISCPTPGAIIRYTTNGVDPTVNDPVIASGGTILVNRSLTLKARAWQTGLEPSSVTTGEYRLITQAPVISPAGGEFTTSINVTVTCPTSGAVIRYTTNGQDPTESDPVIASGASILVDRSLTLKARAWRAGLEPSAVASATFTKADYITIGTGTASWDFPFHTYYEDARTQTIYLASEIGRAGRVTSLALDVTTIPGQVMNSFTIRMKHTALSQYGQAAWESGGWTTVYQANELIGGTGWRRFIFQTPFDYNGVDNLMVDFSFNNGFWTSNGFCRYSTPGGNRSLYFQSDSQHGDPLIWSGTSPAPTLSDCVPNLRLWLEATAVPETMGVGDAKRSVDQTLVEVKGVTVSAAFEGFFYTQSPDRSSGIRVQKAGHGLTAGTVVDVVGTLKTNADGERYIEASSVVTKGTSAAVPLDVIQKNIGGGAFGNLPAGQAGMTGGSGLNNIGLLIRTTGVVTAIAPDRSWLTVWDGSAVKDAAGNDGVRVWAPGLVMPAAGAFVTVTGVSSCQKAGGQLYPLLRVRTQGDIAQP